MSTARASRDDAPDATSNATPEATYEKRLGEHRERATALAARDRRFSRMRLATFLVGAVAAFLAFGTRDIASFWLVPVVLLFISLLVAHDRVIRRKSRAERAATFYERGLARIRGTWAELASLDDTSRGEGHAYANDLDLFGEASLFELVCTARTPAGENKLAGWLLAPAAAGEIRERQAAVEELRDRLDLRENLSLLGEDVRSHLDPSALIRWGQSGAAPSGNAPRFLAFGATLVSLVALCALIFTGAGAIPLVLALTLQAGVALSLRHRVAPSLRSANAATRDLALLSDLLGQIEQEPVTSPKLAKLISALQSDGQPPSKRIAELQRLTDFLDARLNQFFAPLGAALLWGTHFGLAVERWRAMHGAALERWVDAAAEFEALTSISCYAYEHPADPFPEIVDSDANSDTGIFEGKALGHPLLPAAQCVANDVRLGLERRAYMLSGSNMSGKSTLLRTVGTNIVLALAGAPVRAAALRLSPLAIGPSIHIVDSLQDGTSHFYAEIKRLRQVMDKTEGTLPVLFLLDEVLHGTNSHDRRIGAEAVLRGLLDRGAIGLITTHDLALARIADELAPRVENVHFQDTLVDGKMSFDYTLQPGVVTRSNALELMRAVGLDV